MGGVHRHKKFFAGSLHRFRHPNAREITTMVKCTQSTELQHVFGRELTYLILTKSLKIKIRSVINLIIVLLLSTSNRKLSPLNLVRTFKPAFCAVTSLFEIT